MPHLARVIVSALLLPFLFITASMAREERKSHAAMVISALDGFLIPRLSEFEKNAARLDASMKSVCANPPEGDAHLSEAKGSFEEVVRAWAALDFVRFGPVSEQNRLERIFFWPDPRGTAARQLAGILAGRDAALLAPKGLSGQSAAVQGLTALELLLTDEKHPLNATDADAKFRCAFAAAVAANLADVSREILDGWTRPEGFRAKMLAAGSDNPLYKDASETARDVVKAMVTGLELQANRFVAPELQAAEAVPPKRARLPFERTGLSTAYLASALASIEALFKLTGLIAFVPADKAWMEGHVANAWKSFAADVAALETSKPGDPARLAAVKKLKFDLNSVRQIIVRELAPGAELTLGFNELDGD